MASTRVCYNHLLFLVPKKDGQLEMGLLANLDGYCHCGYYGSIVMADLIEMEVGHGTAFLSDNRLKVVK